MDYFIKKVKQAPIKVSSVLVVEMHETNQIQFKIKQIKKGLPFAYKEWKRNPSYSKSPAFQFSQFFSAPTLFKTLSLTTSLPKSWQFFHKKHTQKLKNSLTFLNFFFLKNIMWMGHVLAKLTSKISATLFKVGSTTITFFVVSQNFQHNYSGKTHNRLLLNFVKLVFLKSKDLKKCGIFERWSKKIADAFLGFVQQNKHKNLVHLNVTILRNRKADMNCIAAIDGSKDFLNFLKLCTLKIFI